MGAITYRDVLWDFVELGPGGQVCLREFADEDELFRRAAESPEPQGHCFELPVSETGRRSDREQRWAGHRIETRWALESGRALWNGIPAAVTDSLRTQWADTSQPLRLKISGNSTLVNDLPWEWLCPPEGPPLALRPDLRVCRSIPVHLHTPPVTVDLPIRVLLVLTNPKDESLLNAGAEIAAVTAALIEPQYQLMLCEEPTLSAFRERLTHFEPHIIHYVGHAGISHGDGNLILHDFSNRTYWVNAATVCQLLPTSVRLLCLSTCFSVPNYQLLGLLRMAYADVTLDLPTTVANQYPLDENSVRAFWQAFYSSLIESGGNVNEAVHHARTSIGSVENPFADWASFALVLRDRTGYTLRFGSSRGADLPDQRATELKAKFASQLANDLAEKIRVLGDGAPRGLKEQFEVETKRAFRFLDRLGGS